jgi:hypothetical protein
VKICASCDMRLHPGEERPLDHNSPTGPGITLYVHREPCKPAQTQTAPAPTTGWHRRR